MIWLDDNEGERAPLRAGILRFSVQDLESALILPKDYRITGVYYDPSYREVKLMLSSDSLPEVPENAPLPQLALLVTTHWLPEHTEYRWFETEVKAL